MKHPGSLLSHFAFLLIISLAPAVVPERGLAKEESQPQPGLELVREGKGVTILVIPDNATPHLKEMVESFSKMIEASSATRLPIVPESEVPLQDDKLARLYIGDTQHAAAEGLVSTQLEEETFCIKIRGNEGLIIARDDIRDASPVRHEANSLATKWALNYLLERTLGVRWLWPGELGTYIPKAGNIAVENFDLVYQPRFIERRQRIPKTVPGPGASVDGKEYPKVLTSKQRETIAQEAIEWLENHQGGFRGKLLVRGQPFKHWWDKYSKDHPDYFAELIPGLEQPFRVPRRVKLRLANPAVIEQIVKEYREAGAPDVWKVSPNDSGGFDTSKETRAWDIPQNQSPEAIVYGEANLTARYVKFWNLIYEKLSKINPKVTLNSLAYASYRYPPPPERPMTAKMILSLTSSYTEFDHWKGWADTGSQLILRPNWWCGGGGAPIIPLGQIAKFFQFCAGNQLVAYDFDSIMGYWSTQGASYYLIARLGVNPALTKEEIIDEYASAFGKAAPQIKEYLGYWEALTDQAGFSVHVGGQSGPDPGGLFEKIVKEKGISSSPWIGSLQVMPYLYTDQVIGKAEAILDAALTAVAGDPGQDLERKRIQFLKDGMTHLRVLRDTMEAGMAINASATPIAELQSEFEARAGELYRLRKALAGQHVVWGERAYIFEDRGRQPTMAENIGKDEPDWRAE